MKWNKKDINRSMGDKDSAGCGGCGGCGGLKSSFLQNTTYNFPSLILFYFQPSTPSTPSTPYHLFL